MGQGGLGGGRIDHLMKDVTGQSFINHRHSVKSVVIEGTCAKQGGSQRSSEGKGCLERAAADFEKTLHQLQSLSPDCFLPFVVIIFKGVTGVTGLRVSNMSNMFFPVDFFSRYGVDFLPEEES